MSEPAWLGHRDWCRLQWKKWPCDCPCTKPGCPGIDHCLGTDCPVVAHLEGGTDETEG